MTARARSFLMSIPLVAALAMIGLVTFAGITHAAAAAGVAPDSSLLDLARPVYEAFLGGHYAYAGALLVIVMVALTKRYLGDKFTWLHSDAGGSAMALVAAMATALAAGLAAPGATVTWALFKTSLLVGVGAAGGYAVLKNLLVDPFLKPLVAKLPAWAQPIANLVMWVFDRPSDAAQAQADATKAGDAAVAAAPAQGVAGVVGAPVEVK